VAVSRVSGAFSASYALADSRFDNGLYYFIRQLIWLWIGLIGFNFLVRLPIKNLLKIAPWMILLVLGLILITLIPGLGANINGATRWIKIGRFSATVGIYETVSRPARGGGFRWLAAFKCQSTVNLDRYFWANSSRHSLTT
jgi:cell division protein FtsW (lipid II flippase)